MNKLTLSLVTTVLLLGLAILAIAHWRSQIKLRGAEGGLNEYGNQISVLTEENTQLSNSMELAANSRRLSDRELRELLRLRSIMIQLAKKKEQPLVATENKSSMPEPAPPQNPEQRLSKDSWSFVGNRTPADAFQSMMWAMKNGDAKTFWNGLTPEAQEALAKQLSNMSDSEIAEMLQNQIAGLSALRLDRMRDVSDSLATFILFSSETDDGTIRTRDEAVLTFTNIAGEWKATSGF